MNDDELDRAFLDLAGSKEYDRLLAQMRTKWSGVPREDVRHFIQGACEEVVRRVKAGGTITNLPGMIRTIADRALGKYWSELQESHDVEEAMARLASYGHLWRHDEETVARVERAAEYVRSLVPKLDNENWQRTVVAILDAAAEGRQAENKDLAEVLGAKPDTVGKWKERAIKRLAGILREEGYESLEALLAPAAEDDEDDGDGDEPYDEEPDDEEPNDDEEYDDE
jgi:hypothetical protein